jgi:hypothetical protein
MLEMFSLIERLAKFTSPVLIQGATARARRWSPEPSIG